MYYRPLAPTKETYHATSVYAQHVRATDDSLSTSAALTTPLALAAADFADQAATLGSDADLTRPMVPRIMRTRTSTRADSVRS